VGRRKDKEKGKNVEEEEVAESTAIVIWLEWPSLDLRPSWGCCCCCHWCCMRI